MFSNKTQKLLSLQNDYIERINKNAIKLDKQLNFLMEIQSNLPNQIGGARLGPNTGPEPDFAQQLATVNNWISKIGPNKSKQQFKKRVSDLEIIKSQPPTGKQITGLNSIWSDLTNEYPALFPVVASPIRQDRNSSPRPVDASRDQRNASSGASSSSSRSSRSGSPSGGPRSGRLGSPSGGPPGTPSGGRQGASTGGPSGGPSGASSGGPSGASSGGPLGASSGGPSVDDLSPYQATMVLNKVMDEDIAMQTDQLNRLADNLGGLQEAITKLKDQTRARVLQVRDLSTKTKDMAKKQALDVGELPEDQMDKIVSEIRRNDRSIDSL
jgi:hypothetical protein